MVQVNSHPDNMLLEGQSVTVNSVGGNITFATVCGPDEYEGQVQINSTNFVGLNCCNAFIEMNNQTVGGLINIQTQNEGMIKINTSCMDVLSAIVVSPEFIQIFNGLPGVCGAIQINQEAILLSIGEPGVGSTITMTPESITFQVGETVMTITAEGVVTSAPTVEINCDETNLVYSAEGITEEVGEVTREVTAEGHNFTAGEVELNVGVEGMMAEAPTNTAEFEGSYEMNSALITEAADAMLSVEASISMVE